MQAAIAACRAWVSSAADTDWPTIAGRYALLDRRAPSPVVRLNRAVAVAMVGDIGVGLAMLDELRDDPRLARYRLLPAIRADLLCRGGDGAGGVGAYRAVLGLALSEVDRQ